MKKRKIKRREKVYHKKGEFTRSKRLIVYEALEARLPISRAASLAGVTPKTVHYWMKEGKKKERPSYYQFRKRVKRILAGHEREALDIIRKSAQGGARVVETKIVIGPKGKEITKIKKELSPAWQAAAWYLERRFKEDYGREIFNRFDDKKDKKSAEELAKEVKRAADQLFNSVPSNKIKRRK